MLDNEVYKCIKKIDIQPVLRVIDKLKFENSGGVCAWVTAKDSVAPPELVQLLQSLSLGGISKRVFCRKLMPFTGIAPHIDDHKWIQESNIRRFQIPLISHPEIRMRWPDDGVEVYLEPGYLYEVRVDRTHEVIHNANCERIHLQIDQENATI